MSDNQKLAMCGCRCDLCKAYAPNVEKNDQRETLAQMWNKYYGLDPSVMDSCSGCRNNPSDENCPVRKCVLEKGLNHCGDCGDFPCDVFYQRCGSFPEEKKNGFDILEYNEYINAYDNETRLKEYKKEQIKKVSEATMRFMRGKYVLDEVSNGDDEVAFYDGDQKILTIYIRDGYYDFQVDENTVKVSDMESLEDAKRMILARMEPNRKPFPKTHIHLSNCGHRCDLCIHNRGKTSLSDEEMEYARACVSSVYTAPISDLPINCDGCHFPDCTVESADCRKGKGIEKCWACDNYSTCLKTAGWPPEIHTRTITADEVTWAILPYVKGQYGN